MDGTDRSTGNATIPFDLDTQLGRDLAAVDWSATALGPWERWPASLVNTVRLMTGSRFSMWMAWGEQRTFFCNDAYRLDTLGAKYPWALGRPATEVWSEIWHDIGPLIESVIQTGVATWDERLLLFLERSGYSEETYHTFSYSPIHGDNGAIAGMLCVVSEDTARVISERRMALLRDLTSGLSGASTVAEVSVAAQREIASNPYDLPFALTYLFDTDGTARLEWAAGLPLASAVAETVVGPHDERLLWHAAIYGGEDGSHITDLSAVPNVPTGGWKSPPTSALSVPLRQIGAREPYGYLIVGLNPFRLLDDDYRDFVELIGNQLSAAIARARAFEDERERREQLAELDRAKTTFFTNVSHELRTPLTLLLGPAADALTDRTHPLDAAQRDRIEVVQRNGERLLKLVNTLLDFSRLESGRMEATFEQLDLSRYTTELASMFESAYRRSDLSLQIECRPLPSRPYVDSEMWAKIVLNLLSNALKATFSGGVTVRLSDGGTDAVLEVTDTGVGISETEQARLFERFHRVSGAQLRTYEGSGIGLALVAELVRIHGGTVSVESVVDKGSTFRVTVPYGRDHLDATQVADRVVEDVPDIGRYTAGYLAEALRWSAADARTEEAPPPDGDRLRLLVVDDNADMREYMHTLLAEQYAVTSAANGREALDKIRENPPDLVLTDVMMPLLDGFGLLSEIRGDPDLAHLPVIMLSARSGDDATVEGLEAGADDYLIKPFSARELLARVRANLELDRIRQLLTELERSREVLDHAEGLAHVGSWELDLNTGSVRASAEVRRIVGLPLGEPVDYESLLAPLIAEDRAALERAVQTAVDRRDSLDIEVHGLRLDGEQYLARVRGVILVDEDGRPAYVRGSTQDITEQRAAEIRLAQAEADRQAAAREHAIATELQRSLLPAATFDADQLEIASFYRPGVEGTQVGGDWQDVIDLDDGRTALVIGDVMGRGVRAAAVMGQLRAAVRAYSRLDLSPAELLRLLDDTVREISQNTIVTCVYAVYDAAEQTLAYANAGHLPPLVAAPGQPTRRLLAGGPPLGAGQHRDIGETIALPPESLLALYTDGLVERRGSDLDTGIDQLASLISLSRSPVAQLPSELVERMLPDGPDDDVAILVCRANNETTDSRVARHDLLSESGALSEARRFATRTLEAWQISDTMIFDVLLVVSELTTNAINHGEPPMQIRLRRQRDYLRVEVEDTGSGVPSMRLSEPDDASGRGLLIVSRLADRWGIRSRSGGKTVWARFRLPAAAATELAG